MWPKTRVEETRLRTFSPPHLTPTKTLLKCTLALETCMQPLLSAGSLCLIVEATRNFWNLKKYERSLSKTLSNTNSPRRWKLVVAIRTPCHHWMIPALPCVLSPCKLISQLTRRTVTIAKYQLERSPRLDLYVRSFHHRWTASEDVPQGKSWIL